MLTSSQNAGKFRDGQGRKALARPAHSWLRACALCPYNDKFGGQAEKPQYGAPRRRISDDYGRDGNPEITAPSLSLSDGGWDFGDRAAQANRGHKKCQRHRIALPGTLPGPAGNARRAYYRIDVPDRRLVAVAGSSRSPEQIAVFCRRGRRQVSPSGCSRRAIENRNERAVAAGRFLQAGGKGVR